MTRAVALGAGSRRVLYVAIAGDIAIAAAKYFGAAVTVAANAPCTNDIRVATPRRPLSGA